MESVVYLVSIVAESEMEFCFAVCDSLEVLFSQSDLFFLFDFIYRQKTIVGYFVWCFFCCR